MTHRGPFQPLLFCDSVKRRKDLARGWLRSITQRLCAHKHRFRSFVQQAASQARPSPHIILEYLSVPPWGVINMISYNILINTQSLYWPNSEVHSLLAQE